MLESNRIALLWRGVPAADRPSVRDGAALASCGGMTLATRLSLAVLLSAIAVPAVEAQSRVAGMTVQAQVLPTCAVSFRQSDMTPRAHVSCAGNSQPAVRMKLAGTTARTVQLVPTGRARSAAEIALPDGADTKVLTIQF
jgi:hypothetical protein